MKIKFPISLKQILLFSFLIILVLGVSTTLVSTLIRNDDRINAEQNNHAINRRTAQTIQSQFENIKRNSYVFFQALAFLQQDNEKNQLKTSFFRSNPDILFIATEATGFLFNPEAVIYENDVRNFVNLSKNISGTEYYNSSDVFGIPSVVLIFSYGFENDIKKAAVGFDVHFFCDLMSTGSNNVTMLADKNGKILINPDYDSQQKECSDAVKSNIQTLLKNEKDTNTQNEDGGIIAAVNQISDNLFVITSVSEKSVYAVINRTTIRIIFFSLAVFFMAIILIRIFSNNITNPIKELVGASAQIERGEFELDIKPHTHDEIGLLTTSFVQMGKGLAEREKLMTSFSKFTNKTIAQKAASGELTLGGENREVTIFFSDIRSFTAMSEKMQPKEVVEFLNEYMTKMVSCVNKTGGVVDKYIGDAVMAVWGAPESSGTPADDALNAVTAALMMRVALYKFNMERSQKGLAPVRIGCGINTGTVVAGQIGSEERMEYTVIGDAVNLASRTEALNKPFATDILITENTYNLIKDKIIVQQMPGVHVKGKADEIKMYAVINLSGRDRPDTIEEVRRIIGTTEPDLSKVNTDDEEKKYSIQA